MELGSKRRGLQASGYHRKRRGEMKALKRIAIALGSLMAVVLAGGAHWKV
jgi:hypothetical protein